MLFLLRTVHFALLSCAVLLGTSHPGHAAEPAASSLKVVRVTTTGELRAAVNSAQPGTRIELAPGQYEGDSYFKNLRGEAEKPIILAGADPQRPPRISGGGNGLHLANPAFVELHNLEITGTKANGLSIDDGGQYSAVPRGLVLKGLRISNIGPRGNCDAIKLSGIHGFRVEDCILADWGVGSGSGIDMVGCHDGVVTGCAFRHRPEVQATGGNGVQAKGGSSGIVIARNRFEYAGTRAVNLGGSTGAAYFRPPLDQWPEGTPRAEARNLTVEGNTFIGSLSPVAFVGVDGATVRFNTIYRPGRWALRILQENRDTSFVPCRNGVVTDNIFAFHSSEWNSGGVNIGGGTTPATFRFARNHWFCIDQPGRSEATLPSAEEGGTRGSDPQFTDMDKLDLRLKAGSALKGRGAEAGTVGVPGTKSGK